MALDEAILDAVQEGQASPTLRLYAWDPPCLSIGYAQSVQDVDQSAINALGWDWVRRPTGGKAILHTDEITYSIAAPANHALFANGVLPSYERISLGLIAGLEQLGVRPELPVKESPLPQTSNPVCFQNPGAFEITVDGRKLVGSAQSRRAGGVLQHGSIPISGDLGRICLALQYPSEGARERARLEVGDHAITIERVLDRKLSWDEIAQHLVAGFEGALEIRFSIQELTGAEIARSHQIFEQRYSRPEWTQRI